MRVAKSLRVRGTQGNGVSGVHEGSPLMALHIAQIYAKFFLSLAFEE